ncbi:uncharacterized protein LOC106469172 [Limulus polyphemus]|uniref:Uncharacterized protein LOC106469172 n=1 Tax=Limulus polyphemus TaxID=6850 RepID=A0ABM1BMP1_LIMPO|nr:uncharacterized protein LOC106469172 [Limulus polyphemus]
MTIRISMKGATWWWALIFITIIECFPVTSGEHCPQDSQWFHNQMLSQEDSVKNGAKVEIIKLYSSKSAEDCLRECCEKTYGDCVVSSYIQNQSVVMCYHFQCSPVTQCSFQPFNSAESVMVLTKSIKHGLGQNESVATASRKQVDLYRHLEGSEGDGKFSKPRKGVNGSLSESSKTFIEDSVDYLSHINFFNKTKNSVQPRKGVSFYPKKDISQINQIEDKEAKNNVKNHNNVVTVNIKNDSDVFNYQNKMNLLDVFDGKKQLLSNNFTTKELDLMTTPMESDFQNHKQNVLVMTAKKLVPVENITEHITTEDPVLETSVIAHVMRNPTFSNESQANYTSSEESDDLEEPKVKPPQNTKASFSENYKTHLGKEHIQTTSLYKNEHIQVTPPHKNEHVTGMIPNEYTTVAGHKALPLQDHKKGKKITGNYSSDSLTDGKTNQTDVFETMVTTSNNEGEQPKILSTFSTITVYRNGIIPKYTARVHNVGKKVFSDKVYAEYTHAKNSSDYRAFPSQEQLTPPLYIKHANIVNASIKPSPTPFTDKSSSIPVTSHSPSRPEDKIVPVGRVEQNKVSTTEHYLRHKNHTSTAPSNFKVSRDSVLQTYDPSSVHLIIALVLGLLLLFTVLGLVGKRIYDTWQRRHYHRMDYLVEDFYNS